MNIYTTETTPSAPRIGPCMLQPGGAVLIVEDDPGVRAGLGASFARRGWRVADAANPAAAERCLENDSFDLVVSDMRMPGGDGTDVLRCARRLSPGAPTILLTAFGSIPDAVAAMRMGASDYLIKPVPWEQLESTAVRLLGSRHPRQHSASESVGILGRSPLLLRTLGKARAAASTKADVLIEAESGTGKQLLARYIHAAGHRAHQPFVTIDCAAIPPALLDHELFGNARGTVAAAGSAKSGKLELAAGGTLLMQSVEQLPLILQSKLLQFLQAGTTGQSAADLPIPSNVRILASTTVSLAEAARHGRFRSDLYYRLNVIALTLPSLRERAEDIPLLARAFAEDLATGMLRPVPILTSDFLAKLQQHPWPGNVRELSQFMRRVLSLHPTNTLDAICFDLEAAPAALPPAAVAGARAVQVAVPPGAPIRELERRHLENTLAMTHGNRTQAAGLLGISLRTMRNRIREYGLPPRRYA
jgi:DNA-binding NtrC family response regulator